MHTTNLRKVGGSVMMALPPALLDVLQLKVGATVGIAVADGRLVIDPQPKPQYTLEALLAELLEECCKEYTHRYDKVHKVERDGLM